MKNNLIHLSLRVMIIFLTLLSYMGFNSFAEAKREWPFNRFEEELAPKRVLNPPFYVLEKDGKKSFLLGTAHEGIHPSELPSQILEKMLSSQKAYFEIVLDDEDFKQMKKEILNPRQFYLDIIIDIQKTKKYELPTPLETQKMIEMGIPLEIAIAFPMDMDLYNDVGGFFSNFTVPPFNNQSTVSLDWWLMLLCNEAKVPIFPLENDEVREVSNEIPGEKHMGITMREYLKDDLQIIKYFSTRIKLLNNYRNGIQPAGYGVMKDDENMIYRNNHWIKTLNKELPKGNIFIAVGRRHLYGDYGLLNLLRQSGYKIQKPSNLWQKN